MAVVYEEEKMAEKLVSDFYNHDLTFSERIKYVDMLNYHRPRRPGQKVFLKILKKMEHIL